MEHRIRVPQATGLIANQQIPFELFSVVKYLQETVHITGVALIGQPLFLTRVTIFPADFSKVKKIIADQLGIQFEKMNYLPQIEEFVFSRIHPVALHGFIVVL
jgi:hypothetical protein